MTTRRRSCPRAAGARNGGGERCHPSADRLSGHGYAQLYVDRLRRFVGKNGVDDAMLTEIARLMAARMSYEDLIRIAQLKPGWPIVPHAAEVGRRQEVPAR